MQIGDPTMWFTVALRLAMLEAEDESHRPRVAAFAAECQDDGIADDATRRFKKHDLPWRKYRDMKARLLKHYGVPWRREWDGSEEDRGGRRKPKPR